MENVNFIKNSELILFNTGSHVIIKNSEFTNNTGSTLIQATDESIITLENVILQ